MTRCSLSRSAAATPAAAEGGDGEDVAVVARAVSWLAELVRPVLEPVLGAREDPGLVHIRGRYCLAALDLEVAAARRGDAALRAAVDRTLAHSFLRGSLNDVSVAPLRRSHPFPFPSYFPVLNFNGPLHAETHL